MDVSGRCSTAPANSNHLSQLKQAHAPREEEDRQPTGNDVTVKTDEKSQGESMEMAQFAPVNEEMVLKDLTEDVRNQDDLERDITMQAKLVMIEQEDERDRKRIEKAQNNIEKLETQKRTQKRRLDAASYNPVVQDKCLRQLEQINSNILSFMKDIADIQSRVDARHQYNEAGGEGDDALSNHRMPNESQRDFLIRTGKITPFSCMPGRDFEGLNGDLAEVIMDIEDDVVQRAEQVTDLEHKSHQNLRLPGFSHARDNRVTAIENEFSLRPRKKRKIETEPTLPSSRVSKVSTTEDEFVPDFSDKDDTGLDDEELSTAISPTLRKRRLGTFNVESKLDLAGIDDGNESIYQARLKGWVTRRAAARRQNAKGSECDNLEVIENADEEWFKPCPVAPDHQFENGIKLPGDIHPALFDYQKTGVQWLGELYSQQVGGIIGDEMGLGKTIQIISFLAGLHYSRKLSKPTIIVAPATVLRQWVNEFHKWWPPMRVSILHGSGSGMTNLSNEDRTVDQDEIYGTAMKKSSKGAKKIVNRVVQQGHVLVTTYAGLQTYADVLIPVEWGYAVLDEGHKIRNPNTAITIYCKELKTPNRVILLGTPMQNNLIELWSLFDFVFPMRLGTLVDFRQAFETPIKQGGYASSTNLQVLTATKCAETLKAVISPYLLQRLKVDVASDLPKKTEQVLLVKLTKPQRDAYEKFLDSEEMKSILNRTRQSLYGIDILKKICNHPDLLDPRSKNKSGYKWANPNKSGKMQIVKSLLGLWKGFGHKTLLFSQGVQMLDVLEEFIKGIGDFNFLRMDGSTNIKDRQTLVDRFNTDPELHVFLLTTKVGGLGVNLTGANRVIIFDPDWNPSTDVQARERAWRLGQKKEVIIYRLITAGTIEEKMYHRQIFKQFLSNKVLKDPQQRQTFQMKDLYDLFSLGGNDNSVTETGQMFKGTEVQFNPAPESANLEDIVPRENKTEPLKVVASNAVITGHRESDSEIRNINGVAGLEIYRGSAEEDIPSSNEARIMEGIFAGSAVHSALEHDQIINGKKKITADRGMLEREAKRIAAAAAAELRKAGEVSRQIAPGTVTWTGEFGSAGRPGNARRAGGPSSAGILAGLANRQGLQANASGASSTGTSGIKTRGKDFMKLIQTFIRQQGGSAPSQALVNHFNRMCQTPQQTAEFKHMLGEIARLEVGQHSRMRGRWYLKDEFK